MITDKKTIKSMAQKRARHYGESKSLCAGALLIIGIVLGIVLVLIWPQSFLITIFNSRLMYQLVLSSDDYYACNEKFADFVVDEPKDDYAMLSFYIFSVTNPGRVIQQGFKPNLEEMGPFAYVKNTYRYDVLFSDDSSEVTYKEYSYLSPVTDSEACEAMFYRMERQSTDSAPCANSACKCKNPERSMTIINPLFLRTVWQDTPFKLLAQFSTDVFTEIQRLLDEPFTEAVKAHLVSKGFKEVYQFRAQFQIGKVLNTAYESLRYTYNYTDKEIAETSTTVSTCNLTQYSISNCPFNLIDTYRTVQTINVSSIGGFPTLLPFVNRSSPISFLNLNFGLPRWLGIAYKLNYVEMNSNDGYTMMTAAESQDIYDDILSEYVLQVYNGSALSDLSTLQKEAAETAMLAIAKFIGFVWLYPQYTLGTRLQALAFDEFRNTYEPVICSPLLVPCVWQFGYMNRYYNASYAMSRAMAFALIDLTQEVNTNPISFYIDASAPAWYNAFAYFNNVYKAADNFQIECTNYGDTIFDAVTVQPAGLWGIDNSVSSVNRTLLYKRYGPLSQTIKDKYFFLAANLSTLLQFVYRTATGFHDEFVVRYLNKNKDPNFSHNFTVGNWTELGLAQWGGGFVTHALVKVRTTKQIVRDGMWNFGFDRYYINYLELGSWCVRQGFMSFWLYDIEDSRVLLAALSRRDQYGVAFRERLMYVGSTFFGDGINYVNSVGDLGEVTFTPEANRGNFSCTGPLARACEILNTFEDSSAAQCAAIDNLYDICFHNSVFLQNRWINLEYCGDFQTSLSNPSTGIPCDSGQVYGNTHPYRKSRGNVVFQMLYSLTYSTNMQYGKWCDSPTECGFEYGGLFVNATAQQVLFEGYSDAALLYYLQLTHESVDIDFECAEAPYDICGIKNYRCTREGIYLLLPNSVTSNTTSNSTSLSSSNNSSDRLRYLLAYNATPPDEFFAPYFLILHGHVQLNDSVHNANYTTFLNSSSAVNRLIWPFSSSAPRANFAKYLLEEVNLTRDVDYSVVKNPNWAAYPAWDRNSSDSVAFLKYYQCLKRLFNGVPHRFSSCDISLYTGTDGLSDDTHHPLQLRAFYGNASLQTFASSFADNISDPISVNGSIVNNQYPAYYWSGFASYPYGYLGRSTGANFSALKAPIVFNPDTAMSLTLTQTPLIFTYQRQFNVRIPFDVGTANVAEKTTNTEYTTAHVRRFVEWSSSWQPYRTLAAPRDSYGMTYKVPIGMASLQGYTNFPVFVDTPKSYGNELWLGIEFSMVAGTSRDQSRDRTYIDYDPVTGRAIRQAIRQQITLRVEANALFPILFSSQSRCVAPTKTFAGASGYGCFGYLPLLWYEDARTIDRKTFFRWKDHFYTRPDRGNVVTLAGLVIASFFVVLGSCVGVNEWYQRRKFNARVYID